MMTIASRLLQRRTKFKLSQRALGKIIGVSAPTISLWETDKTYPNGENLIKLSQILKTTPEWIVSGIGSGDETNKNLSNLSPDLTQPSTNLLPILSQTQAGKWIGKIDQDSAESQIEWEESPKLAGANSFWLRVIGDSMTSPIGLSITEGMLILINPDIEPENGKLVVAKLEGTNDVTFKKLVIDAAQQYLKPLNPDYKLLEINSNCRIVGVVTELKLKL